MRTLKSIILVLLVLTWYANAESCSSLECWLENLSIPITNTTLTQNQTTLTIDPMNCNNITVPALSSAVPAMFNMEISATIGMNCNGKWHLTANTTTSGTLEVVVAEASISMTVSTANNGTFVSSMDSECDIQVNTITLNFNSGGSSIPATLIENAQSFITSQIINQGGDQIQNALSSEVDYIFQGTNNWISNVIQMYNMNPPFGPPGAPSLPPVVGGVLDLTKNPVMGLIDYVLNDVIGYNGTIGINKIIDYVTNNTGAVSIHYSDYTFLGNYSLLSKTYDVSFGQLTISPLWINASGLNNFGKTRLAVPVNNNTLDTYTLMNSLSLKIEFLLNLTYSNGGTLVQTSVLQTTLQEAELFAELSVLFNKMLLDFLTPNQLLSPGCLTSTIQFIQLNYCNLSFIMDDVSVMPASNQIPSADGELLNAALGTFVQSYSPALSEIISYFMWSSPTSLVALSGLWPVAMNKTLTAFPCYPHFDGSTMNKFALIYASVAAVGLFFLLILIAYLIVRLYEDEYIHSKGTNGYYANSASDEKDPLLTHGDGNRNHPLMLNPSIPSIIRYGTALILLLNTALFISSNASVGASVYLVARTAEGSTIFPSLFNFSLINSVKDMWNAKVYALSILIALFSGVWPYTKLILMLVCWCTPGRLLNLQRRGRILIMLDAMGKWSLIDSFVLILMMVAFHFSIVPPVTANTPEGSIKFEAYVAPHYGFYSFLVATMLSLVITHFIIKVHDFSLETAGSVDHDDGGKEALWAHATTGNTRKGAYILTAVTVLLCISAVLIGFGITIKSFDFTFKGAFGLLLNFLDQPETIAFSVVSLGNVFPSSSIEPDSLGTRFIQVTFFIFAVAMPIAYVVCLLVLWMVPLTYKFQSRLLTLTATIHAWSALEVFVISIIAALLELRQFAQFIIGHRCDLINKILGKYAGDMLHGDDKCFDVVATLKTGCWVLFAACVIYVVVGSLVVRGCHKALKSRLEKPTPLN